MKLWIKLSTTDKVAMVVAGAVIYTIWIIPTAIAGGTLYAFRDNLRAYVLKQKILEKINGVYSYFLKK